MENKNYVKISFGTAIGIISIIILIMLICLGLYINKIKYTTSGEKSENNSEITEQKEGFEDALVNYIVHSIEVYVQNGAILKDTTGDVTASKLSSQEFEDKKESYEKEIKNMLKDYSIISKKFIKNNKECCIYDLEKILNKLGLGTHMGYGIGCYDTNNKKIYEYGKTEVEEYLSTNSNIIKYFGYDASQLVNSILEEIEKCASNNYILKDTTGDVTASKLTLLEAQNNRQSYEKIINQIIDDTDIFTEMYFENNKLISKCDFEKVLNKLGIGTHMGMGIDVDEEGIQVFIIE